MTVPELRISRLPVHEIDADVLVLGVRASDDGPSLHFGSAAFGGAAFEALETTLSSIGVTGGKDELVRVPASGVSAGAIALVGLGSSDLTTDSLRYAAGTAARRLVGVDSIVLALPVTSAAELRAVLEGAAIGAYSYTAHRASTLATTKLPATLVTVATQVDIGSGDDEISRATIVSGAVHSVRDLVNTPPSHLYPETFADAVVAEAADLPVTVEVFADEELRAGGFGGILGVGAGSTRGPRLVKLVYSPTTATKHLALVGKGITFDSGGLSLKPAAGMVGMKDDMTGAATVSAVLFAAARLGLDVKLTAWLCIAENMPSGSAIRPNDVLVMRGGTTVEVLNTDAEGRLVLADGIVAACEEYPDAVVDVATLTGAQVVALGSYYSGLMGDEALVRHITDTGMAVGERLWPMPLPPELRSLINSDVADIANAKIGNTAAGMLLAGIFLKEFVGDRKDTSLGPIPWAHLDIAGPSENKGVGFGFTGAGPTGVTVRTLVALAEEFSLA